MEGIYIYIMYCNLFWFQLIKSENISKGRKKKKPLLSTKSTLLHPDKHELSYIYRGAYKAVILITSNTKARKTKIEETNWNTS